MPFYKKRKLFLGIIGGLLLALVIVEGYLIVDQAVTITYMKDGYKTINDELEAIVAIINTTDLSKSQIERSLENNPAFEGIEVGGDTMQLYQHELIFRNKKLVKIAPL